MGGGAKISVPMLNSKQFNRVTLQKTGQPERTSPKYLSISEIGIRCPFLIPLEDGLPMCFVTPEIGTQLIMHPRSLSVCACAIYRYRESRGIHVLLKVADQCRQPVPEIKRLVGKSNQFPYYTQSYRPTERGRQPLCHETKT